MKISGSLVCTSIYTIELSSPFKALEFYKSGESISTSGNTTLRWPDADNSMLGFWF